MTHCRRAILFSSQARPAMMFLLLLLCVFIPLTAYGQIATDAFNGDSPWRIHADRIAFNRVENEYRAEGDVLIIQGDKRLRADRVRFNRETMIANASGNIHFTAAGDSLVGDRLIINLDSGTGTLYKGILFVEENHFFIRGDKIEKTGETTFRIHDADLTACEQKYPDWRITGTDVIVSAGGYGTVRHAAFWVKRVPVLYVPFFVFPVKSDRQSGFLPPQADYSDRNGVSITQPFYWAINENSDATFYYQHIENRGEKPGFEYRYILTEESKGTVFLEGFNDRKVDDGAGDSSEKWGYRDDTVLRPNSDRYWFRMKADQELAWDLTTKLDLDIVSDQDYLREFDDGYTGFDETEAYFESEFGRDLDDENDPVRENRLNLNRNWMYTAFNADFVWYDNVINRRQGGEDDTLQRLPMVSFSALKQPFYGNLVYSSLNTEYDHFYREDGTTGHRADIHPRVFLPLHAKNYFTLEPSIGVRQTVWYTDAEAGVAPVARDRYAHRELYDIGTRLSTDINRIFPVSFAGIERIKHTIVPMIEYSYIPDSDQSQFPDFDEVDRIDNRNFMAFSMTHFFTSKRVVMKPAGAPPDVLYNMFGRVMIEQPYAFASTEDTDDAWQPLFMELDFTPINLITLHADAEWSHRRDAFESGSLSFRVADPRGDLFRVDYRYNREINKSVYFETVIPITYWLDLYGDYERNLMDNQDIEKRIGALYKSGCWSVDFSFQKEESDKKYGVLVNLYGLGEIGKGR